MTDHQARAVQLIAEAESLRQVIDLTFTEKPKDPLKIGRLETRLRHKWTLAKLHTNLAEIQSLDALRLTVVDLFEALTAKPGPPPSNGRLVVLPERES